MWRLFAEDASCQELWSEHCFDALAHIVVGVCCRKVGKGGAKMVKAGLKAAKKGAGVASAHSTGAPPPYAPALLPTTYATCAIPSSRPPR